MSTLPKKSLVGLSFERLLVVDFSHKKKTMNIWKCVCACGSVHFVSTGDLTRTDQRAIRSCGCLKKDLWLKARTKHGKSGKNRTYLAWQNMRRRCFDKNRPDYKHYGGRGISVCKSWDDFSIFVRDLGECPKNGSLERIDVNGNYCPENCRWIDKKDQPKNARSNISINYLGKSWRSWELEKLLKIPANQLRRWHKKEKNIEQEVIRYKGLKKKKV